MYKKKKTLRRLQALLICLVVIFSICICSIWMIHKRKYENQLSSQVAMEQKTLQEKSNSAATEFADLEYIWPSGAVDYNEINKIPLSKNEGNEVLGQENANTGSPSSAAVQQETTQASVQNSTSTQSRDLPIYSVQRNDNKISITFDSSWGADDIDIILEILNRYHCKATFFMDGGWVRSNPDAVLKLVEHGQELASHGDVHQHTEGLTQQTIMDDINTLHARVKELTGIDMTLYRPPYGEYNNVVLAAARACGYETIHWNVDSVDWKNYGVQSIVDTVCTHPELTGGAIVLLHHGENSVHTKDALEPLLKRLTDMGFQFVPASELILRDNYYINAAGKQIPINN